MKTLVQEISAFQAQPSSIGKASTTIPTQPLGEVTVNTLAMAVSVGRTVNLLKQFDRNGNVIAANSARAMVNAQFGSDNQAASKTELILGESRGQGLAGKS